MFASMKKKDANISKILVEENDRKLTAVCGRGGNDRRARVTGNEQRENAGDAGRRQGR
tara:strand:+ start:140 stop:313 length:174 start_codon:yes stop_codon:yes gene_type:complete